MVYGVSYTAITFWVPLFVTRRERESIFNEGNHYELFPTSESVFRITMKHTPADTVK